MAHRALLGFALALAGCASHIAPAPPVELRVADPIPVEMPAPTASACWVEYARSGAFTASGVVVRTPSGIVLVDAGQSAGFRGELGDVADGRFYLRLVPGKLVPDVPADEVLAGAGVDPTQIAAFVATHVHSDHVGGLMDLPDLPVRLLPAELAHLARVSDGSGHGAPFNVIPAEARRILPTVTPLDVVDGEYMGFTGHADLFDADDTVVVVPLSGHTPGSVGVLIRAGDKRLLAAGDAINTHAQLDRLRGKSWLLRRTDTDRAAADAQVARLASVHAAFPDVVILPAHEREAWVDAFGAPGGCVGE